MSWSFVHTALALGFGIREAPSFVLLHVESQSPQQLLSLPPEWSVWNLILGLVFSSATSLIFLWLRTESPLRINIRNWEGLSKSQTMASFLLGRKTKRLNACAYLSFSMLHSTRLNLRLILCALNKLIFYFLEKSEGLRCSGQFRPGVSRLPHKQNLAHQLVLCSPWAKNFFSFLNEWNKF